MTIEMTTDLQMLLWVSALTLVLWLPYVSARILRYGLLAAISYKIDEQPVADWAVRAKKAHYNAVENLVPFAVVVLIAQATGTANETTATATTVYFWARLAHYPLQVSNLPAGRTVAFAVGWLATATILFQVAAPAVSR